MDDERAYMPPPQDAATRVVGPPVAPPDPVRRVVDDGWAPIDAEIGALREEARRLRLSLIGAVVLAVTAIVIAVFALVAQEQGRPAANTARIAELEDQLERVRERDEVRAEQVRSLEASTRRAAASGTAARRRADQAARAGTAAADAQTEADRRLRRLERDAADRDERIDSLAGAIDGLSGP